MNTPGSYSALRELRAHMTAPTTLAALSGVALLATLIGPFDTGTSMRPAPRFGYWLVMAGATYAAGYLAAEIALRRWGDSAGPLLQDAVAALATAVAVPPTVLAVNAVVLGAVPRPEALPGFLATLFAIAVVVTGLLRLALRRPAPRTTASAGGAAAPAILERLPLDRRGPLVSLSVEDHYVRVRTMQGESLVLMRLGDAIREAGQTPGLQVHRSHWVALDHVRAARRDGERAVLTMAAGPDIPVSRANVPALRDAGLLPK